VHIVRVSSKGQIVIPKEVREKHKIRRNSDLIVQDAGDSIILRNKSDVERILADRFHPFLRAAEKSLAEIWNNPEDDVWDTL
jgi:AbrB family looped-hinge helix DNA binding protein